MAVLLGTQWLKQVFSSLEANMNINSIQLYSIVFNCIHSYPTPLLEMSPWHGLSIFQRKEGTHSCLWFQKLKVSIE